MVWPIIDLIETVGGGSAPKTSRIASDSVTSSTLVAVLWAAIMSTSEGWMPAWRCAHRMQVAMLGIPLTGWPGTGRP